jgi:hypothetical protein
LPASILSADFSKLDREMAEVDRGGADFWHLDVMDGHFVPNISFGPHYVESIRPLTKAFFDAHLMISEPVRYAPAFIKAGVDAITFHVEVAPDVAATARELREARLQARRRDDEPGDAGRIGLSRARRGRSRAGDERGSRLQRPEIHAAGPAQVRGVKKRLRPNQRLEIDGGIHPKRSAARRTPASTGSSLPAPSSTNLTAPPPSPNSSPARE